MQISHNKKPIPKSPKPRTAHQIRIIGGQWKRTPLAVLDADGLRPTPDRVRETVFNWLNHLMDGAWDSVRCLDLFAGTGALGFEAASRGAAGVTMVEDNIYAVRQLDTVKTKLNAAQVQIMRGDALAIAQRLATRTAHGNTQQERFHIIFLDPPYHQDWLGKMLPVCEQLLAANGLMYVESEMPLDGDKTPAWMHDWRIVRQDRAGMVFYHLLQRNSEPEIQA